MAFATPSTPNLPDFWEFLNTTVQIPTTALPTDSPWPGYALDQALVLVLDPPCGAGILYTLACYNCATHLLLMITPDQPQQEWFANIRGNNSATLPPGLSLNAPTTGLIVATSDESTSATLTAPTWAAGLTVGQLGFFKTPWGREYLGYIQSYGPTVVGLT